MQVIINARRVSRVFRVPSFLNSDHRFLTPDARIIEAGQQWRNHSSILISRFLWSSGGIVHGDSLNDQQYIGKYSMVTGRASFSSAATSVEGIPTEAVKELYDKMLQSVKAQTMPPNAYLWSLIEKCSNNEDIKLLFDILQNLRRFRLSHLRIHSDFNCNLCREITKACVRVGALHFGKKALWKHNVYGLSPSIASAHQLLLYAKEHNDANLMEEIMKLLKRNDLPLQPGTADIVFSICYNTDNWQLISKYSKKFVKAGVNLRRTSFDIWINFAAKIGDTESLWKIEKLRSESMKKYTLASGFACIKGFLLERKPENAAAIVLVLYQDLSEAKRSGIVVELQKLVSEWPLEVIRCQKEDERQALAASLKTDIPAMVSGLLNNGLELSVNMEELNKQEGLLSF